MRVGPGRRSDTKFVELEFLFYRGTPQSGGIISTLHTTSHDFTARLHGGFTAASRRLHGFTKTSRDFTKTQKLHVDFTDFSPASTLLTSSGC